MSFVMILVILLIAMLVAGMVVSYTNTGEGEDKSWFFQKFGGNE